MKKLGPKADPRKGESSKKKGAKRAWGRETTELKRKGQSKGRAVEGEEGGR